MKSIQLANDQFSQRVPFDIALAALDVYPIASAKIKAYEQEQLDAADPPTWLGLVLEWARIPVSKAAEAAQVTPWILLAILSLSSLAALLAVVTFLSAILIHDWVLCMEAIITGMVATTIAFWMMVFRPFEIVIYPARWQTVSWQEHLNEPVPRIAMRLQASLATLFPEATFRVRELRQGRFLIDPILLVVDTETNIEYPILIWDQNGNIVSL